MSGVIFGTYHSVDELEVTRALRVAVSSTILGSSGVGRVLGHATIGVHGDEVQRTVEAALSFLFSLHSHRKASHRILTGSLLRSTSKENSLFSRVKSLYLVADSMRYSLLPMFLVEL